MKERDRDREGRETETERETEIDSHTETETQGGVLALSLLSSWYSVKDIRPENGAFYI